MRRDIGLELSLEVEPLFYQSTQNHIILSQTEYCDERGGACTQPESGTSTGTSSTVVVIPVNKEPHDTQFENCEVGDGA